MSTDEIFFLERRKIEKEYHTNTQSGHRRFTSENDNYITDFDTFKN